MVLLIGCRDDYEKKESLKLKKPFKVLSVVSLWREKALLQMGGMGKLDFREWIKLGHFFQKW